MFAVFFTIHILTIATSIWFGFQCGEYYNEFHNHRQ